MATVVSFKRCRLVRHQKALFQRELPAPLQGLQCSPREASIVVDVERAETARGSLQSFFSAISSLQEQLPVPDAVTIPGVGLRIDASHTKQVALRHRFPRQNVDLQIRIVTSCV